MKVLLVTQYKNEIESKIMPKNELLLNHFNRYHKKIYETLIEDGHEVALADGLEDNILHLIKNTEIVFPIRSNYPTTLFELNVYLQAERYKKRIVGSSSTSKMLECDKIASKLLIQSLGIKTPKFYSLFDLNQLELGKKYIIKKRFSSSSIGLSDKSIFIYNENSIKNLIDISNKSQYFIEEFIEGIDISIGVLFSKTKKHMLSHPYTMKSLSTCVVTFEQKKNGVGLICDFSKNRQINKKLNEYAINIFNHIQPCEYSRMDFILTNSNELFFLEYNNTPNLSHANYFVSSLINKYFRNYKDFINYLLCQAL